MNMEKSDGCLFCDILGQDDDRANWILYRGEHCFVVVNTYPYSNGHIMVVCNRHAEKLGDLSQAEATEFTGVIATSEHAILDAYKPDGINMGANIGRSAGAGILGHLHMHLVPRWQGDTNFITSIAETRVISEDLVDTYERLAGYFGSG